MQQGVLVRARRQVWDGGMVFVRIDRNPGRLVVMCRELWIHIQKATFLHNDRYVAVNAAPSVDDTKYAADVRNSFLLTVHG